MVLKGLYGQGEPVTIVVFKKYFTLGGCCDPERLVRAERTSYNNSY